MKTARRDLEALAIAGIPVYSQAGRNGGWSLIGGARTDLSGLTDDEARTLFLVAGPSSTATPAAKAALRKLVQALPETFRAGAERAAVGDRARSGVVGRRARRVHRSSSTRCATPSSRPARCAWDTPIARWPRPPVVHPLGLVEKGAMWYLVAGTEKGMRTFRVNRVRAVEITDDPVVRPPDFDLAETWRAVVDEVEGKRAVVQARLRTSRYVAQALRAQFGPSTRCRRGTQPQTRRPAATTWRCWSARRRAGASPATWPAGATWSR